MRQLRAYLRQHHVGLLAILLILGGGTAYAVTAPKNSVVSTSIKNGAVKSADLKNGAVKSADLKDGGVAGKDVRDGTLTGADVADRSVQSRDLDPKAVDEVQVYYYATGSDNVVWSDPEVGTITFSLDCGTFNLSSFVSVAKSPARGGAFVVEDVNQGTEASGTTPLTGASTVSRLGDVGLPVGGAGFSGSKFGFGQAAYFIQTPTLDVHVDLNISLCSARGTISIDHKPEGSVLTRQGARPGKVTCEASGAGYCRGHGA